MPSTSRAEKKFRSVTKLIAEELRAAILSGKLAPGERFSEEKLAASMKVSQVPLRDGLRGLEAEGYVTFISHGEIVVSKATLDEVENHYSIAGALEGLAARLAVERVNAEEISRLRELHRALKEAYQARDLQRYFNANSKFHGFIGEIAGNEHLHRLIQEMRQEIRKSRILVLQLPQRLDYSMREHDQILDSFLKKNSELAQSLLLKHLNNQMMAIKTMLQSEEDGDHA